MNPLIKRRDVAQAAIDRFAGQPFVWGKNDCVRLAAFVLRGMGHKPSLARGGSYASALAARRALKKAGFDDLPDALDALGLQRIPPAAALPCDLIGIESEDPDWTGLTVAIGNGRALGFGDGFGRVIVNVLEQPRRPDGTFGREPIAWRL